MFLCLGINPWISFSDSFVLCHFIAPECCFTSSGFKINWLHPDWILACSQPFAKRGLRHFNLLNAWKAVFESPLGDENIKQTADFEKHVSSKPLVDPWHDVAWLVDAWYCECRVHHWAAHRSVQKYLIIVSHHAFFSCISVSFMACCMRNHNCEECEFAFESHGAWLRMLLPPWGTYFVSSS